LPTFFFGGSQLLQQILWDKFHIRCAYFTPYCTWSPNYSVLVSFTFLTPSGALTIAIHQMFVSANLPQFLRKNFATANIDDVGAQKPFEIYQLSLCHFLMASVHKFPAVKTGRQG
jgi:hypothetical protein